MSRRQPASASNAVASRVYAAALPTQRLRRSTVIVPIWECASRLMRHLRNRNRLQALHKPLCINNIELGIGRFHAKEELVPRHPGELFHVEQWVIRHG